HLPGSPKTINVAYTVGGLTITPAELTFSSAGIHPDPQTITLAVTGGSPFWTLQYLDLPSWLSARPRGAQDASAGPNVVDFTVNPTGLPAGVYSAKVNFSTPPSFFTALRVTFFVGDPSVNFVAPHVVRAGRSGEFIIRGRGFSALSPDTLSVQFNDAPAQRAAIVSDTEIRGSYPLLGAGSYSISVSSGATSIPSRAALKLVVIDPPAFPLHTIARPASAGRPANLIYDAERQALL